MKLRRLWDAIRAPFHWKLVRRQGAWTYWENTVTGKRDALRDFQGGYQPLNEHWVNGGAWDVPLPTPPRMGSAAQHAITRIEISHRRYH